MDGKQNLVNQMVVNLMRDDAKVEELLGTINELSRKENSYEYGLPTHDAGQMSLLKTAVLLWVQSLGEAQP